MGWPARFLFTAFLIVAAAIHGIEGDALVSGTVFCDRCKDGRVTLFDFPLNGMKVSVFCPGDNGQTIEYGETTTNFMGSYTMRFQGSPDLTNCVSQVSSTGQGCGEASGSPQTIKLVFRMFDMAMYTVDPLISQPAQPMPYCLGSSTNPPPVKPPTPPIPPLPPLPPMSPVPFFQASACPSQMWAMPENRCYWRTLIPDLKVALVFGPLAARRYGTDITLLDSMRGRGDPYKTLLREATTALLNSYHSIEYPYRPLSVVIRTNYALLGSTRNVLRTALRFKQANSGYGNVTCNFTPCT
ncbi:Pollen-specific protein-like [Heracleum sosnowskyi]|uniref:Pollen-specific protein-like n=1 Tax=Heracleum sosnowskyi TaxID=360622 RepID=A0AAD8ME60_9APIA|nr:Pollen-specific protein-like [Heracleum sosnowskyi]